MRRITSVSVCAVVLLLLVLCVSSQSALAARRTVPTPPPPPAPAPAPPITMWINHLDFLPGDPSVTTSFNAITSGVGGGLSGLVIQSTTAGEGTDGDKVVEKGLQVPPGFLISGVRVCYELSSANSFISQIRLSQVQDPPESASILLDDATDQTAVGPVCVNSAAPATDTGTIDPGQGAVRLSFRVNFGAETFAADRIVLRAVGLLLKIDPKGAFEHSHIYLTGKGIGHNNTQAVTGPPIMD